jgi:hypothetical protein
MNISRHGDLRARERMGIPRKAIARAAKRALTDGRTVDDYSGTLGLYLRFKQKDGTKAYTHNGFVFVFGAGETLVTVIPLPRGFR